MPNSVLHRSYLERDEIMIHTKNRNFELIMNQAYPSNMKISNQVELHLDDV